MGAFQNKAVQLVKVRTGEEPASQEDLVRDQVLRSMLELYQAAGGSLDELIETAHQTLQPLAEVPRVDVAMGDLMQSLALLGYVHDIDIIQAGYNTLDAQIRELRQRHDLMDD
ncbi:hypothetical protein [Allorhizobium borbori]|uniref:Uncharacterized protein n=1 Tax=Allorhizobium borbori TaxID=485907 RepID=A0A7W6K796_9HYPH|nr:hypothetical protein [Allorhizobium borbori]MBB4105380.1 hypothetical protein [Allorhizobium borbori]